jgi:DNA-binding transcriptional regulator YhcF (GntR family)
MNENTEKFNAWIKGQIKSGKPGYKLPFDHELAKSWNISERTVKRILKNYRENGDICRIPGKGTFIQGGKGKPSVRLRRPPKTSTQNIIDAIYKAICTGELKRGEPLPPIKFMSPQFRVAPSTVIKAYQELQQMGRVVKVGKTFWVGSFRQLIHPRTKKEVYLFCYNSYEFSTIFKSDRLSLAYQRLEEELSTNGYLLLCESTANMEKLFSKWLDLKKIPYGLIFFNINEAQFNKIRPSLKQFLDRTGDSKPGVLIDYAGDLLIKSGDINAISRGHISTMAARIVARHIIENRYREAIFCLDESNITNLETAYTWTFWQYVKIRTEIKNLNERFIYRLIIKPAESDTEHSAYFKDIKSRLPAAHIRGILSKYRPTPFSVLDKEVVITDNFKKALAKYYKADLWVFSSHEQAAQMVDFAEKNGIKVPEEVSIICLESDPSYYHLGVSTCEIDWAGIGYLMAHAVIKDFPIEKTTKGFIKTIAYVKEKITTP